MTALITLGLATVLEIFAYYIPWFDNLLDTHVLGITYKDGQEPVEILAKKLLAHRFS